MQLKITAALLMLGIVFAAHAHDQDDAQEPNRNEPNMHYHGMGEGKHHHSDMGSMGLREDMPGAWTQYPTLSIRMIGDTPDKREVIVVSHNMRADFISDYPSLATSADAARQVPFSMTGANLGIPDSGGFHWILGRETGPNSVRVASSVFMYEPKAGKTPTAMFTARKNELEIIPIVFPREHSAFRANEFWKFLLRFNGAPLVNQKIALDTRNGSHATFVTDAHGNFDFRVPDDLGGDAAMPASAVPANAETANAGPMRGMTGVLRRKQGEFVLAATYDSNGTSYVTGFSGTYGPDAYYQRNLAWGIGFIALGMIAASPLLRNRKLVVGKEHA